MNAEEYGELDTHDVASVSVGRHGDIDDESLCTHAVKKVVSIETESTDTSLYVVIDCGECGIVSVGEHREHEPDRLEE